MRTLQDLPIATSSVRLLLTVRRFRCTNTTCPRQTFVEPLTDLAPAFARRTQRLTKLLTHLGLLLGGQAGHRLAQTFRTPISPATLLRIIRRTVVPVPPSPTVIGIDDWALAKGQRYGTIVVDLERHRPLTLLPDRTAPTVATWLRSVPTVEAITRDRSNEYARGAAEGAPHARQIADRWHLLQNLGQVLERLLQRLRVNGDSTPMSAVTVSIPPTPSLRPRRLRPITASEQHRQHASHARRMSQFDTVQNLLAHGLSRRAVARLLEMSRGTVHKLARAEHVPERAERPPQPSILDPYLPYLEERWTAGSTNAQQLWREIHAQGYPGGPRQVARWAQHRRRSPVPSSHAVPFHAASNAAVQAAPPLSTPVLHTGAPRQVVWLLLRRPDELSDVEQAEVRRLRRHPHVALAHELAQQFQRMVRERQPEHLDTWMAACTASSIPELQTFAHTLRRDADAVRNALQEAWSQGQTEGQITRLKLIRRQLYGRGKLDLLSRRFLAQV
jgi:transposase